MNVLTAAITGLYTPVGNLLEADCVIGQSFGASEKYPGSVNESLAQYIVAHTTGLPLLLQQEIAEALPEDELHPALVIRGNPSTSFGGGLTTWEVLQISGRYMESAGLSRPLLVAQAFHVGRVAMQAKRQGLTGLIVPAGLPTDFDPNSIQPWTRSRGRWVRRELLGIAYAKLRRQI